MAISVLLSRLVAWPPVRAIHTQSEFFAVMRVLFVFEGFRNLCQVLLELDSNLHV